MIGWLDGFRFEDPQWLAALPVAMLLLWHVGRRARRSAVTFSSVVDLRGLPVTIAQRIKRLLPVAQLLGVTLLVVALARPQQGREETRVRAEGIDIIMAIDRSSSMEALDFEDPERREPVNRLHVVKQVFRQFVAGEGDYEGRTDDQIGLVAFGGYAENRCPLTLDHGALLQILDTVEIPGSDMTDEQYRLAREFMKEEAATAIGDGLALAVDALRGSKAKSRVIILLSDGKNTAGVLSPADGAELAKAAGIKVYTVGIGSTGTAPFPVRDPFGRVIVQRQRVELDERTLEWIADHTGGEYFNARDTDALEEVVGAIDALERTELEGRVYTDYRELFGYVLLPAIGLLLLELVMRSTRFASLP